MAIEARRSRAVAPSCQSEVKEMPNASATCASACLGINKTTMNTLTWLATGCHDLSEFSSSVAGPRIRNSDSVLSCEPG